MITGSYFKYNICLPVFSTFFVLAGGDINDEDPLVLDIDDRAID